MGDYNDNESKLDNQQEQQTNQDINQQQPPQFQQPNNPQSQFQQTDDQQPQNQQPQNQQPQNQQPQYQQPQYQSPSYQQTPYQQSQYQQPAQPGYEYQQYQSTEQRKSNGMSIAALVLGIISFLFSCIYFLSIPSAIVGLILGIVSIRGNKGGKGMAIAGIILSGIGLLFSIVIVCGAVALFRNESFMQGFYGDFYNSLEQYK